jgi:hypothetical protein
MKLPRHAEMWLPGYIANRAPRLLRSRPDTRRVWLAIVDHYEPLWQKPDLATARGRVELWRQKWPESAARSLRDSAGNSPQYTFFFPQEEYRPEFLEPLAEMTRAGIADVEVHLHHDGEGREDFVNRITTFCDVLHSRHGLLRKRDGKLVFGFIHGNWALDNSRPDGRWCGLNDEITLLRELGCYADFTMPSGNSPTQARTVNVIYWAKDDPAKPKSYDSGIPVAIGGASEGDLLMIPGPLGLRWKERLLPRMETGELASTDHPTPYRVQRWFDLAPRLGSDIFIKLYTHGAQERNSSVLLNGALQQTFAMVAGEAPARGCEFYFVTAWQMYLAVDALRRNLNPLAVLERSHAAITQV